MAKLTDEELAQKLAEGVEPEKVDEPEENQEPAEVPAEPAEEPQAEPEAPAEEQAKPEPEPTFTKPEGYEWVKGDTLEEFNKNLLVAYENSTAEALRLKNLGTPQAEPEAPATPDINSHPAIVYAQSLQQKEMIDSFNEFSKTYPQAKDPVEFDRLEKASKGVGEALAASLGRQPTYAELFGKIATVLDWQPSDKNARKDAAIKETGASPSTVSSTKPTPRSDITEKQLEVARRMFPGKSDSELIKELSETLTT